MHLVPRGAGGCMHSQHHELLCAVQDDPTTTRQEVKTIAHVKIGIRRKSHDMEPPSRVAATFSGGASHLEVSRRRREKKKRIQVMLRKYRGFEPPSLLSLQASKPLLGRCSPSLTIVPDYSISPTYMPALTTSSSTCASPNNSTKYFSNKSARTRSRTQRMCQPELR